MAGGARSILDDGAKRAIADAVRAVESRTAAEVVVALRPSSASYRQADYLLGFLASFAALLIFLFYPADFHIETMPIDALVAFGLGVGLSAWIPPIKRLLTSRSERARAVALAARAAFVDLGVSKTAGRTGILVYVSRLERAVELVSDVGVDPARLDGRWGAALATIRTAARGKFDAARFAAALTGLSEPLAAALPRAEDDVNELPDEVV